MACAAVDVPNVIDVDDDEDEDDNNIHAPLKYNAQKSKWNIYILFLKGF